MGNDSDDALFAQLAAWSAKGYQPELLGGVNGWIIRLDSERGVLPTQDARRSLRFATDIHPTPQAAIEAALKVIQP